YRIRTLTPPPTGHPPRRHLRPEGRWWHEPLRGHATDAPHHGGPGPTGGAAGSPARPPRPRIRGHRPATWTGCWPARRTPGRTPEAYRGRRAASESQGPAGPVVPPVRRAR